MTESVSTSILDEPDFIQLENAEEFDFVDLVRIVNAMGRQLLIYNRVPSELRPAP